MGIEQQQKNPEKDSRSRVARMIFLYSVVKIKDSSIENVNFCPRSFEFQKHCYYFVHDALQFTL
ncbi:hypothetical protein DERF_002747 [Dermatophagoides farinae]|uniref:Uncharacterized protein n=1 Tax=Dermatophagoides farinae TaxID=6954 RepID=A0A922IEA7_DERFA|nr:hypothetical protein DERF_002747 [Dermatophagoides farinae]